MKYEARQRFLYDYGRIIVQRRFLVWSVRLEYCRRIQWRMFGIVSLKERFVYVEPLPMKDCCVRHIVRLGPVEKHSLLGSGIQERNTETKKIKKVIKYNRSRIQKTILKNKHMLFINA